eukprot:CAMPEP_0170133878 /NCGR_PEP_ID=MMETSP0033_2-20121228/1590_1 /TAXON_ID=195969 /ORGANISM="Dolichomastix tenuilepis, Strain CCMP3274" /LENGTH=185 /DNA_ID=CAMNT_0010369411 /DNA_START=158 /DNA_END=712 /DNA_ORIENTATION=-
MPHGELGDSQEVAQELQYAMSPPGSPRARAEALESTSGATPVAATASPGSPDKLAAGRESVGKAAELPILARNIVGKTTAVELLETSAAVAVGLGGDLTPPASEAESSSMLGTSVGTTVTSLAASAMAAAASLGADVPVAQTVKKERAPPPFEPKPKLSKAERRELQERQRAEKAAKKAAEGGGG